MIFKKNYQFKENIFVQLYISPFNTIEYKK